MNFVGLLGLLAASSALAKDGRQENAQVESSASFDGASIEGTGIKQPDHLARRLELSAGVTLMDGASVKAERQHESHRAGGSAKKSGSLAEQSRRKTRTKDGPGVTWAHCVSGYCECNAVAANDTHKGLEMIVRFMQLDERYPNHKRAYENSYHRQHWEKDNTPYTHTPKLEFSKGFKRGVSETTGEPHPSSIATNSHHGDFSNIEPHDLQQCGGWESDMKDCYWEPETCEFATDNPYDAQVGEYCCDPWKRYCSYRCRPGISYNFKCPARAQENNLPGGMNPAVFREKGCFVAAYCSSDDPDFHALNNPLMQDDEFVENNCDHGGRVTAMRPATDGTTNDPDR